MIIEHTAVFKKAQTSGNTFNFHQNRNVSILKVRVLSIILVMLPAVSPITRHQVSQKLLTQQHDDLWPLV